MAECRKPPYFGRMISTAFPPSFSSRLRPDTTSPSPPALATGAHSGATITTYTIHQPRSPGIAPRRELRTLRHLTGGVAIAAQLRTWASRPAIATLREPDVAAMAHPGLSSPRAVFRS